MNTKKELKDLNLLDRFLFAEAAEDPEFLEKLLQIILEKPLELREQPQAEKEERKATWSKQIRLDVWAIDQEDTVYDIEAQKKDTKNLRRRSRLYHGIIDSKLLEPGAVDYNRLPDSYVIMIMPFDIGGRGLYRYTFEMMCKEVPGLSLEDGVTRIFLNTRGTVQGKASRELVDLLKYIEDPTVERVKQSGSEKLRSMHKTVERIRSSEEIGVKYMQEWEEKALDRQEAYEEGQKSGLETGRKSGIKEGVRSVALEMKKEGMEPEQISRLTKLTLEEVEQLQP